MEHKTKTTTPQNSSTMIKTLIIKFHNKNKAPIDRAVNNGSHTVGNLLEDNKEIKSFNALRLIIDKHIAISSFF